MLIWAKIEKEQLTIYTLLHSPNFVKGEKEFVPLAFGSLPLQLNPFYPTGQSIK